MLEPHEKRSVTERDFRLPEFKDANPADYEFRDDGKIVRRTVGKWRSGKLRASSNLMAEMAMKSMK